MRLSKFYELAEFFEAKSDEACVCDTDTCCAQLVWAAAASSLRRVCLESQEGTPESQDSCQKVANILHESDIVWSRYGSDTIDKLAERIVACYENGGRLVNKN
jgi:hypothetical protein